MNIIRFWAHSYCRSTFAFYKALAKELNCELFIYTFIDNLKIREKVGFDNREFKDLNITHIGNNEELAFKLLCEDSQAYNIFCAYQNVKLYQKLIYKLINDNQHYGILSEAPCNMFPYPKHILKELYHAIYLPLKLKKIIQNSDFILNCSGYYETELRKIGWKPEQIISCGYFSPRIIGSECVRRAQKHHKEFNILLSGLHEWHRSSWLLLKALNILKKEGLTPQCYITQEGPYINELKTYSNTHTLHNVHFLGFVDMSKLINLYENCSIYIGCGNYEPWGMRLNDVLQCGAPLIVNRGMGGVKMVDTYKCGSSFERNDYKTLALEIKRYMTNEEEYLKVAENAFNAAYRIAPEQQAKTYAPLIINKIQKS